MAKRSMSQSPNILGDYLNLDDSLYSVSPNTYFLITSFDRFKEPQDWLSVF